MNPSLNRYRFPGRSPSVVHKFQNVFDGWSKDVQLKLLLMNLTMHEEYSSAPTSCCVKSNQTYTRVLAFCECKKQEFRHHTTRSVLLQAHQLTYKWKVTKSQTFCTIRQVRLPRYLLGSWARPTPEVRADCCASIVTAMTKRIVSTRCTN